jgi:hypothetical protein
MEAVTDKLVGDKDFNLRVAFGKTLTEHNNSIEKTVHRYLYQFPESLLPKFRRLCAEKNISILKESKKEFSEFEFGILEVANDGRN